MRGTMKNTGSGFLAFLILSFLAAPYYCHAEPPRHHPIQTIYVIPSSHWDLGFIAPPEKVLPRLKPHLDEVIANCKMDPEFRWTIESVWQLRQWLSLTKDPKQIQDLVDLVRKGQIQVSSVWGSLHTEFMGAEELNRLVYDGKALQRQLGFTSDFAMMDDVPGFSLALPQVLARSGIKYFLTGSNLFFGGGTSLHPSKSPFYWQSPDGSKVLMWQTQGKNGGYTEAIADYFLDPVAKDPYAVDPSFHFYPKEWTGLRPLDIMQRGMEKLLHEYEKAGYPYDAALVMYLHDFVPSTWERDQLLPNIRAWNAAGKQPKIVVATPAEFFHHLESKYGSNFPVYAGDWTGLWSEVKSNSPVMSANARWAQDHFPVAELIDSVRTLKTDRKDTSRGIAHITTELFKYDEHSGAGQYGWPKILAKDEVEEQNREYADYTSSAREQTQALITKGLIEVLSEKKDQKFRDGLVVFNPLGWERSELVAINAAGRGPVQIRDLATHTIVPQQMQSAGQILFQAKSIPPFGYRTYQIEPATLAGLEPSVGQDAMIDNLFYRVEVRRSNGAIVGIYDKQLKRQLVDPYKENKPSQLLRSQHYKNLRLDEGGVTIETRGGSLMKELVVRRNRSYWPETSISLPTDQKLVMIENTIDREKMPRMKNLEADTYAFSFPFKFTGSSRLWTDDGLGFHQLPTDYLPGARTDAVVPKHALILESTEDTPSYNVLIAQRQSFFDIASCLPGPKGRCGMFQNEIRSVAMRKADQGETRDQGVVDFSTPEPGLATLSHFSFAISSARSAMNPVSSYRRGNEFDLPLIVLPLPPSAEPANWTGTFLSLTAPNTVLQAFKANVDGNRRHWVARIQEIAGKATEFKLLSRWGVISADELTMTEDNVVRRDLDFSRLSIGPHETLTLGLTLSR
jgi:Glycosyl hydrolases family 38 N-terminal domain/Glycosyl hydrolases family 38 C-terminal domain